MIPFLPRKLLEHRKQQESDAPHNIFQSALPSEHHRWRWGFGLGVLICTLDLGYPFMMAVITTLVESDSKWFYSLTRNVWLVSWLMWLVVCWIITPARLDREWLWMRHLRWTTRLIPTVGFISYFITMQVGSWWNELPEHWSSLYTILQVANIGKMLLISWIMSELLGQVHYRRLAWGLENTAVVVTLVFVLLVLRDIYNPTDDPFFNALNVVNSLSMIVLELLVGLSFFRLMRHVASLNRLGKK